MSPSIRWLVVALGATAACKGTEPFVPVATTVTVAPGAISFIAVGAAQTLSATVLDQRGNALQNPTVTWSTGNPTVATVDQAGIVTSRGNGSTQITATSNAGPPAAVVVQAGDNQRAAQSTPVAVRPAVQVRDQYNNLVSGAAVSFTVDSGGGSVTGANPTTTNTSGIATVGGWTVGNGNNTLIATVSGSGITGNPVTFHATGVVPGPPQQLIVTAGNGQTGLIGYALNVRPAVEGVDVDCFSVANKLVTFARKW